MSKLNPIIKGSNQIVTQYDFFKCIANFIYQINCSDELIKQTADLFYQNNSKWLSSPFPENTYDKTKCLPNIGDDEPISGGSSFFDDVSISQLEVNNISTTTPFKFHLHELYENQLMAHFDFDETPFERINTVHGAFLGTTIQVKVDCGYDGSIGNVNVGVFYMEPKFMTIHNAYGDEGVGIPEYKGDLCLWSSNGNLNEKIWLRDYYTTIEGNKSFIQPFWDKDSELFTGLMVNIPCTTVLSNIKFLNFVDCSLRDNDTNSTYTSLGPRTHGRFFPAYGDSTCVIIRDDSKAFNSDDISLITKDFPVIQFSVYPVRTDKFYHFKPNSILNSQYLSPTDYNSVRGSFITFGLCGHEEDWVPINVYSAHEYGDGWYGINIGSTLTGEAWGQWKGDVSDCREVFHISESTVYDLGTSSGTTFCYKNPQGLYIHPIGITTTTALGLATILTADSAYPQANSESSNVNIYVALSVETNWRNSYIELAYTSGTYPHVRTHTITPHTSEYVGVPNEFFIAVPEPDTYDVHGTYTVEMFIDDFYYGTTTVKVPSEITNNPNPMVILHRNINLYKNGYKTPKQLIGGYKLYLKFNI